MSYLTGPNDFQNEEEIKGYIKGSLNSLQLGLFDVKERALDGLDSLEGDIDSLHSFKSYLTKEDQELLSNIQKAIDDLYDRIQTFEGGI